MTVEIEKKRIEYCRTCCKPTGRIIPASAWPQNCLGCMYLIDNYGSTDPQFEQQPEYQDYVCPSCGNDYDHEFQAFDSAGELIDANIWHQEEHYDGLLIIEVCVGPSEEPECAPTVDHVSCSRCGERVSPLSWELCDY